MWIFLVGNFFLVFFKPTLRGIGKIVDYYIWGGGGVG
jgi:hypothetical protein